MIQLKLKRSLYALCIVLAIMGNSPIRLPCIFQSRHDNTVFHIAFLSFAILYNLQHVIAFSIVLGNIHDILNNETTRSHSYQTNLPYNATRDDCSSLDFLHRSDMTPTDEYPRLK